MSDCRDGKVYLACQQDDRSFNDRLAQRRPAQAELPIVTELPSSVNKGEVEDGYYLSRYDRRYSRREAELA